MAEKLRAENAAEQGQEHGGQLGPYPALAKVHRIHRMKEAISIHMPAEVDAAESSFTLGLLLDE